MLKYITVQKRGSSMSGENQNPPKKIKSDEATVGDTAGGAGARACSDSELTAGSVSGLGDCAAAISVRI